MAARITETYRIRAALRDWITSDGKRPNAFGLHYPFDAIYPAFQIWLNTDYRVLPAGGGYMDQDWRLMEDFATLAAEYGAIKREIDEAKNGNATG